MTFLMEWVAQIILFIILATIIDLLIPQSSFQKYIKLAIGLILILILLNPVFSVLNIDIREAVSSSMIKISNEKEISSMENLIDLQKKEIESAQHAYILEQMAVQLKNIAEPELKDAFAAEIANIEFVFENNRQASYENLNEIIVTLTEGKKEEGMMKAVEDVEINTDEPLKKLDNDEEIIAYLEKVWELQDKKITIFWEGGTS
ncbi:stage III sporulation protein AF [Compostibacillus humi]|uniref:Stage III sporulation protein AF n=1 Tax=Compostibacillus humi TaxID=1245525 RepID=A0A8J2TK86_9BACI|nr:stage III sporulation protein AF [Compostibacillus humi]GFZ77404.1 stage III sporulation protein AF [Compostibacillus humi]HLT56630.1 stage III sporulation protein AF [Bacillota bacterium]